MQEPTPSNRDTRAAWHYHNGTKHPSGFLMNYWHTFDPASQPMLFKVYRDLPPIPLPLDKSVLGLPALSAIATTITPNGQARIPDVATLARILYFSAGITKRMRYPGWGEMLFRAAACTGALYHIELYVVCGDLPGFTAGVYHFDPREPALSRLRPGDYRGILVQASGQERAVAHAPAVLVYSDVFWRNACKYQAREYRHAFWDSGTIISHTLATATAHELPARVVLGFVDDTVNQLLGLDTEREVALALVPLGYTPEALAGATAAVEPLSLQTVPVSDHEIDFPAIRAMHQASSLLTAAEVAAWRKGPATAQPAPPAGQLIQLEPSAGDAMRPDPLEPVILRRGSARRFARQPIAFQQLSTILDRAVQAIPADFLEPAGASLNQVYLIANAVEGLASGAYVFHRDRQAMELLKAGNFRGEAGQLALGQDLAADASANVYFLADLAPALARFGNRGYRAAQLEASIAAGRVYLAAYAQGIGATGLTFYDDGVSQFFSPHAWGKSVMFLVALGHKAGRS